ncbi:hypothetical protein L596_008184 [Steinernema carpocapsae]|uniref:Ubiquitinyl hydrolase variant UBP zinc finger domain-containing protein n=1 Tax=Steinernema carpocapsae TaxID=34508 RepID=A0A4U5PBN9_STECR|nr:hypothetical protein L596_008184 [Steinernema carpocapsae]
MTEAVVLGPNPIEGVEVDSSFFANCRYPGDHDKVYKDECMFCFHSPFHLGGIMICLKTFMGFCSRHIKEYHDKSGARVFVKRQKFRIPVELKEPNAKITKLAIGVQGGFKEPEQEVQQKYTLMIFPDTEIELNDRRVSSELRALCDAIVVNEGAFRLSLLEDKSNPWEIQRKVTKFADVVQLFIFVIFAGK